MSVIGRLDKQVEEVLIAPIARRHEQKDKERETDKQRPTEAPQQASTEKEPQSNSE